MKKNILPLSIKVIIVPAGSLFALILLSFFAFKIGLSQIRKQQAELAQSRKNEKILTAKMDLLSTIESSIGFQTNTVVAALPNNNSAILALSQIREIANNQNLFMSNIKIGAGSSLASAKVSTINISFDVEGDMFSLFSLISAIKQLAPITHLTKAVLNFSGLRSEASISVKTYWADFPTKIPAVLDPSTPLNETETSTLDAVSGLSVPPLVNLAPSEPFERISPFGN